MSRNRPVKRHRAPSNGQPLLVVLVVASLVSLGAVLAYHYGTSAGTAHAYAQSGHVVTVASTPTSSATPSAKPTPAPAAVVDVNDSTRVTALSIAYPKSGPGTFHYANTTGPVLGTAGPIRRFRLAIESNIAVVSMSSLAAKINSTLGDPRSWIASGTFRLQQVPPTAKYQFTIYLATQRTVTHLCAPLVVSYTSCRQGPKVVLNLARWVTSVPYYTKAGTVLDTYRSYMINHETGHELGHGHELCSGTGKLAPVMEQQTLGLHGCRANPWPFVNGKRYDGPAGEY